MEGDITVFRQQHECNMKTIFRIKKLCRLWCHLRLAPHLIYFVYISFCSRMIHSPVLKMVLLYCILSCLSLTFLSLKIVSTRSDYEEVRPTVLVILKIQSFLSYATFELIIRVKGLMQWFSIYSCFLTRPQQLECMFLSTFLDVLVDIEILVYYLCFDERFQVSNNHKE